MIVQTGFSTNLAGLLDSPEDIALVRDKVALVVAMAGNFADGAAEYNVKVDAASAKAVFERWPTPIVFSGLRLGAICRIRRRASNGISGMFAASDCGIVQGLQEDAV